MNWTPFVAYCVGLITTDGCLSGDRRHIEFSSKDRELVEYVRSCFGPQNKVCRKSRGGPIRRYYRVQLGNVHLYQWLCSLGLTPRKSLTLGALKIPDAVFADFLRGHLDGDGTFTVYNDSVFPNSIRLYVRFCSASRPHLDWLQVTISRLWSLKGYQVKAQRSFRLVYAKAASIELLKYLYTSSDSLCLGRKRRIVERFLTPHAEVAELADATVSEAVGRKVMRVQLPPSAFYLDDSF